MPESLAGVGFIAMALSPLTAGLVADGIVPTWALVFLLINIIGAAIWAIWALDS